MLAYENTEDNFYLDWFNRVHDYSFKTFSNKENGEWYQKYDRRVNRVTGFVRLPVKDPFHLPRAIMFVIQSLERIKNN